jgi:hypothetical protein
MTYDINAVPLETARLIVCVVPDDGTDRRLIRSLREARGIITANSTSCRSNALVHRARTERGRIPPSEMVRMVEVLVRDAEAEALFGYIFDTARIDRPNGGIVIMTRPIRATPYHLPPDLKDEET